MRKRVVFFLNSSGCRRRCVYCDQGAITGAVLPGIEEARSLVCAQTSPVELCFFGGSFTCLPEDIWLSWLSLVRAAPRGSVARFSTHPRCVDARVAQVLSSFPLSVVELGISSFDDRVLKIANRDYSGDDALCVIALLLEKGFDVCAQMMLGLPGQTLSSALSDLDKLDAIRGENTLSLRIYPCLVLKGTPLEAMYAKKEFAPLGVDEAVVQAGEVVYEARRRGFDIIRVGLQESESLSDSVVAGPHHPALGEMALAHATAKLLHRLSPNGDWQIERKHISLLTGHNEFGIKKLAEFAELAKTSPELVKQKIKFV